MKGRRQEKLRAVIGGGDVDTPGTAVRAGLATVAGDMGATRVEVAKPAVGGGGPHAARNRRANTPLFIRISL
jgi:hypothetical protein